MTSLCGPCIKTCLHGMVVPGLKAAYCDIFPPETSGCSSELLLIIDGLPTNICEPETSFRSAVQRSGRNAKLVDGMLGHQALESPCSPY
jgi:hypothetical protein